MSFLPILMFLTMLSHSYQINEPDIYHAFRPLRLNLEAGKKIRNISVTWFPYTSSACARLEINSQDLGTKLVEQNKPDTYWKVNQHAGKGELHFLGAVHVLQVKVSYHKPEKISLHHAYSNLQGLDWLHPGDKHNLGIKPGTFVHFMEFRLYDAGGSSRAILFLDGKPQTMIEADNRPVQIKIAKTVNKAHLEIVEDTVSILEAKAFCHPNAWIFTTSKQQSLTNGQNLACKK